MLYTLFETLCQIDPYVQLDDGQCVATVEKRLASVDREDSTHYAIRVDSAGRLVIYQVDFQGYPMRPAAFVEEKRPAVVVRDRLSQGYFGSTVAGYA